MELKKLGVQEKGAPNQDGAVWGKELFRLNHLGECVVRDGVLSEKYGVPVVTLMPEDILEQFDTPYHLYIQGACCHKGKIYSAEGFGEWAPDIPAGIRVVDLKAKKQELYVNLDAAGYPHEPECIDFVGEKCVFADAEGNFYEAVF